MDLKAKVDEIVKKLQADPALLTKFQNDPEKTIEGIAGIDIPDGMTAQVITGVKAALAGSTVAGAADALKKLF